VIALLPVAAILFIGAGLLGAGELKDLALVLFVGMLSGTYSSICIATPVLADLKEREPQYRALAKRVSLRAAGGRSAKRAAAKAAAGNGTASLAADGPGAADDDAGQELPADGEQPGSPAGPVEPVPAGRAPGRGTTPGAARPGPRQQPRRPSTGRRRPGGKKKRR
jgi:preprotein translocase subunit SecF